MATGQDEQAEIFTRLVEPHFDRLFRLAYRLTGTRNDAEDLLQDVLTRLYEQRQALPEVKELKPWLSRVLYNRFIDTTRATQRRPLTLVGDGAAAEQIAAEQAAVAQNGPDGADPATLDRAARRTARLEQALSQLSRDHRTLVLMHDAEGYTLPEIADLTGTPTGTLKSRLSRARARLRDLLRDLQESPEKKMEPFTHERRVCE